MLDRFLQDAVTLFVVIDPIGIVPAFLVITRHHSAATRRNIALLGVTISALILIGFILIGQVLLDTLGISLTSFRIAGGIVLLIVGIQMVLASESEEQPEPPDPGTTGDLAVFPLATPLIAGPGAIMTVVILTDKTRFSWLEQVQTAGITLGVLLLTYVLLIGSEWIQRLLGVMGVNVVTRVFGLLLAALAIETILTGISDYVGHVGMTLEVSSDLIQSSANSI